MPPYQGGGGMIDEVKKKTLPLPKALRNLKQELCKQRSCSFQWINKLVEKIGLDKISEIENKVLSYGIEKIKKNNSISLIGDQKKSFCYLIYYKRITLTTLQQFDDDGVAIRAGHHCCQILHEKIRVPATARASIGLYNSKDDIDVLLNAINKCKKVFKI